MENISFKVTALETTVGKLETEVSDLKDKVSRMETEYAVSKEKIDSIFTMMTRMDAAIQKIADKIESRDQRPINLIYVVIAGVIGAIIQNGIKFLK